jgi:hypothetical protein
MGMRYEDFWYNYDMRELSNAIEGYYEREERHNREAWEQTRIIYAAILNKPVYGYKIRHKTPAKLLPFPWDNEGKIPDKDELEQLRQEVWGREQ